MLTETLKHKSSTTTEKGRGRAQEILHTARGLLAAEGYAALSMRRVAGAAGISLSNLQHYYPDKDALLEALLLYTMDVFQYKIDAIAEAMPAAAPIERFLSTMDMFLEELTDPVTHALFFEIWALASHNAFASKLMDKMLARERKTVVNMLRTLNPALDEAQCTERAILMVAQVEGLMLFRLNRHARKAEFVAVRAALRRALTQLALAG
jgi:AcrR family transcriptional regulator